MTNIPDIKSSLPNPEGADRWAQELVKGLKVWTAIPTLVPDAGTYTHASSTFADDRYILYRWSNHVCNLNFLVDGTLSSNPNGVAISVPIESRFEIYFPAVCFNNVLTVASQINLTGTTLTISPLAGTWIAGRGLFCGSITYFTT